MYKESKKCVKMTLRWIRLKQLRRPGVTTIPRRLGRRLVKHPERINSFIRLMICLGMTNPMLLMQHSRQNLKQTKQGQKSKRKKIRIHSKSSLKETEKNYNLCRSESKIELVGILGVEAYNLLDRNQSLN